MPYKICSRCGANVEPNGICPQCGKDQRSFFKKHKIIGGLLVILFIITIIVIENIGKSTRNNNMPVSSKANESSNELILNTSNE